jgi:hypothetical protein
VSFRRNWTAAGADERSTWLLFGLQPGSDCRRYDFAIFGFAFCFVCLTAGISLSVDTNNHRIQFFDSRGNFLESWGNAGKRDGQLWYPRKVAWMPETSRVVVCDRGHDRSRVQIFSRSGAYVRTIHMDYVAIVAGMTVYRNQVRTRTEALLEFLTSSRPEQS